MKKDEIFEQAIQQFETITGAGVKILDDRLTNNNNKADRLIELKTANQNARFWVEIKSEIREHNVPGLLKQINDIGDDWLLICQYIPKPVKQTLKDHGVNYLETAGNCFIQKDGIFFYINDKAVTAHRQPKEGKLWNQAGLKFLFGILTNPELLNVPYRQIAQETKVALGNIGPFIEELKQEGFLKDGIKSGQHFNFIEHKDALQKKWIELFNIILRPKLKEGRFRFADKKMQGDWQNIPADHFYWGAEPAGAILTGFLEPEVLTVYTKLPKMELIKELRLVPDKNGQVELMHIFWEDPKPDSDSNKNKTVPPLLAYAELITSLDSRNRETAERLKQQYLDSTL
ncbi:MAG: hypothetical protein JWP81_3271 [Ferruginibacter sp.]|nr:hypothetical protein [Ferruginibacter sp.]